MLRERVSQLFADCDPAVQQIIADVLALEWEKLSLTRPRVKEEIDQIIDDVTKEVNE